VSGQAQVNSRPPIQRRAQFVPTAHPPAEAVVEAPPKVATYREHDDICAESFGGSLSSHCHVDLDTGETRGVTSIFGGPLRGMDKYLGAAVGDDGCIYAIPGSAKSALKIVPKRLSASGRDEVHEIGDCRGTNGVRSSLRRNQFKWLRGVTAADSRYGDGAAIYGIPSNANAVLKIVPRTGQVTTLSSWCEEVDGKGVFKWNPQLPGRWKWHGGVVAANGSIYAIPACADRVLRIIPRTGEVRLIGDELLPGVESKWYGGLLGCDGAIYGMPHNADCILKIVPEKDGCEDRIEFLYGTGDNALQLGGYKWHGGVAGYGGPSGKLGGVLYAVPSHANRVLRLTVETGAVELLGTEDIDSGPLWENHWRWKPGQYKYGGAVLGPDNCVYCLPYDAYKVLKISPSGAVELMEIEPDYVDDFRCHNKWQNGFAAADGCIYAIPVSAPAILKVDSRSGRVSTVGRDIVGDGKEKWEGGVVNPADGTLYCVPQNSSVVLKIDPCGTSETL